MIAKALLPALGGVPSVWNASLVFYQSILLAGYVYAHNLSTRLRPIYQWIIHSALIALVILFLPLKLSPDSFNIKTENPFLWVFASLFVSVGLPFFVLSATAPLVQAWIFKSAKQNPYILYSASNLGSLSALAFYLLLIEPTLSLDSQSKLWSGGYAIYAAVMAISAYFFYKTNPAVADGVSEDSTDIKPTAKNRLVWFVYAFVPSGLLVGVTTFMTTDIAPVPLFWVIPLGYYLLSFVIVFAPKTWIEGKYWNMCCMIGFLILCMFEYMNLSRIRGGGAMFITVLIHIWVFFTAAMILHGRLASDRPHGSLLTTFYFWISLGGVAGGLFSAIIAPMIFSSVIEYPLLLLLAVALRPINKEKPFGTLADAVIPATLYLGLRHFAPHPAESEIALLLAPIVLLVIAPLIYSKRRIGFALVAGVFLLQAPAYVTDSDVLLKTRNFFGVITVKQDMPNDSRLFLHGNVLHGSQAGRSIEPSSYYARTEPIGTVMSAIQQKSSPKKISVIGLGIGMTAGYALEGQEWTFYEVDPAVVDVAKNDKLFTYLSGTKAVVKVVTGDGRLKIGNEPSGHFDLIIVDAFSSSAIPVHLVTKEAVELYAKKLSPSGTLIFHITNRYQRIKRVLAPIAREGNLDAVHCKKMSEWFVMTKNSTLAKEIADQNPDCKIPAISTTNPLWTDSYSSILRVIDW